MAGLVFEKGTTMRADQVVRSAAVLALAVAAILAAGAANSHHPTAGDAVVADLGPANASS